MPIKKQATSNNDHLVEVLDAVFSSKARVDFGEDGGVVVRLGDISMSFSKMTSTDDVDNVVFFLKDEIVRKYIKGA